MPGPQEIAQVTLPLLALLGSGLAQPEPSIDISPAVVRRAVQARPTPPRPPVPIHAAGEELLIDGRISEPWWSTIPEAPPPQLLKLSSTPPATRLRVAAHARGLVLATSALPSDPGARQEIQLDAAGTRQSWIQWRSTEPQVLRRCSAPLDARDLVPPQPLAPHTFPCSPIDRDTSELIASSEQGWEILIPWEEIPGAIYGGRIGWLVKGSKDEGGSYAANGAPSSMPHAGRVLIDPSADHDTKARWIPKGVGQPSVLRLQTSSSQLDGPWEWSAWHHGARIASGQVELSTERSPPPPLTAEIDPGLLPLQGATFQWRQVTSAPLAAGAVAAQPRTFEQATLATPIFSKDLVIATSLSAPYPDAPLTLSSADGEQVLQIEITVPAGPRLITIPVSEDWPDRLRVQLGSLLEPETMAWRTGTAQRHPGTPGAQP